MFKNKIISSIIVVALAAVIFIGYRIYVKSQTQKGSKEITVEVIIGDEVNTITFKTDKEILGEALDEQKLIVTKSTSFGRYVVGVNGRLASDNKDNFFTKVLKFFGLKKGSTVADEDNQEWWFIAINGEAAFEGIDDIAIKDGDVITFELKVGY